MKVSIVTISFNQAAFLSACIESVLNQDYDDVEYIVLDPGSTDDSREIIKQYSRRITQTIFEPDAGPADGLNKGFRLATGEIYGYINADDILLPGALKKVVGYFEERIPKADVILGHGYRIDVRGNRVERLFSTKWSPRLYAYGVANAVQQSTFFRAEAFHRAGGFNATNRTCWDGELLVDMALAGAKVAIINEYLGDFRHHSESISGSGRRNVQYISDQQRISEKILGGRPTKLDWLVSRALRAYKNLLRPDRAFYKMAVRASRCFHQR